MSKATKRKHVAKELQEDLTIPTETQNIVQLVDTRGNNLHDVIDSSGEQYLVSMPVKFRRNIWVKRGDFVLVEPIPEGDKVKAEIVKILTKEHIKYYRSQNVWPSKFDNKKESVQREISKQLSISDDESDIFVNTNRNPNLNTNSSESSNDSSESEED